MISEELKNKIIKSFSNEEVKKLLIYKDIYGNIIDEYYLNNKKSDIHSVGFCYLASLLVYHIDGKSKKWIIKKITDEEFLNKNGKHYFLLNKENNEILDLTSDQFKDKIPYDKSRGIGIRFVNKNVKKFASLLEIEL